MIDAVSTISTRKSAKDAQPTGEFYVRLGAHMLPTGGIDSVNTDDELAQMVCVEAKHIAVHPQFTMITGGKMVYVVALVKLGAVRIADDVRPGEI